MDKKKDIKVIFIADSEMHKKYKILCIENGYVMSERFRQFMERDIEEHKNK